MLDIKKVRETPDVFRKAYRDRGGRYLPALEELIEMDQAYREALTLVESLRAKKNELSKSIGVLKRSGQNDADGLLAESEKIKIGLQRQETGLSAMEPKIRQLTLGLPNAPDPSVPMGAGPQDNRVVKTWGEPKILNFKPLDHHELGERLGLFDFERAAKLAGSRFALLTGQGAALERALISFMLDLHTKEHGYKEFLPPLMAQAATLEASGHLPKFREDLYKIETASGEPELYLIPTSEVSLVNLHRAEALEEETLPRAYTSFTACFRSEAGSYGKDTRGLIRNHQFNKVELVRFALPEKSMEDLEIMTRQAETVLERLGIPYRRLELCTADLGFASAKTYDLEVWMPGENTWREISSCSNCLDFQARRADIKVKRNSGKREFVHTLNGSGVAIGRCMAAV
ncbi:MAG: serine--tRNA ligase, partial [Elusimicrobiota bacterium]